MKKKQQAGKVKPKGTIGEDRVRAVRKYLEEEVWPLIPKELLGKKIAKREREEILGIGPHGYPE